MNTVCEKKELCSGCGACSHSCGLNAIQMIEDGEGFFYPVINNEVCVKCGKCRNVCPFIKGNFKDGIPEIYAAKNISDNERRCSASGGLFTLLSDYVLDKGGVVYGAVLDSAMQVVHHRAVSEAERNPMRGSKYVQSNLGDIFVQVHRDLANGRMALFTGTPCQIVGLKAFLGKDYSNLYTCDIVCHGVTSPKMFKEYISFIEKKYGSKIKSFSFRDKEQGWTRQKWKIELQSGQILLDNKDVNIYKKLFYGHVIQRPSCHECPYASIQRQGDVTLGDFWGIENSLPDFKDELGINVVLINTKKGKQIFEKIKGSIHCKECDVNNCLQPQLQYPTRRSDKREQYWLDYRDKGFVYVAKKYGMVNYLSRLKGKLIRIIDLLVKTNILF